MRASAFWFKKAPFVSACTLSRTVTLTLWTDYGDRFVTLEQEITRECRHLIWAPIRALLVAREEKDLLRVTAGRPGARDERWFR